MNKAERERLKAEIIRVLNETRVETSLDDLISRLREKRADESFAADDVFIKAAIWQLVAEDQVQLTSKRTLRIADRYRSDFALAT